MAFNLKKVLKALLLSSSQPLSIKEVQAAFARFHESSAVKAPADESGSRPVAATAEDGGPKTENGAEPTTGGESQSAGDVAEVVAELPQDPELYVEVPSLVTVTQIREAMDEI